ncbi:MAG: phosphoribosylformylglycinamidine cyclo-ligase, partial [Eubacterium sp.]|nr:phosphoribosylformylglycinamidine cyclo-ligase [Eubacterium sp.]
ITGGGFYENIPRMLPDGIQAVVEKSSYEVPPIFRILQKEGGIEEEMMYNTYNMGVGMVLCVKQQDADKAVAAAQSAGDKAFILGSVRSEEKGVILC